jgi:hypothetical protein
MNEGNIMLTITMKNMLNKLDTNVWKEIDSNADYTGLFLTGDMFKNKIFIHYEYNLNDDILTITFDGICLFSRYVQLDNDVEKYVTQVLNKTVLCGICENVKPQLRLAFHHNVQKYVCKECFLEWITTYEYPFGEDDWDEKSVAFNYQNVI